MTLPSTGAIGLSNVNTELGRSGQIDMNGNNPSTTIRSLFGVPTLGSQIAMSNGRGKSAVTRVRATTCYDDQNLVTTNSLNACDTDPNTYASTTFWNNYDSMIANLKYQFNGTTSLSGKIYITYSSTVAVAGGDFAGTADLSVSLSLNNQGSWATCFSYAPLPASIAKSTVLLGSFTNVALSNIFVAFNMNTTGDVNMTGCTVNDTLNIYDIYVEY